MLARARRALVGLLLLSAACASSTNADGNARLPKGRVALRYRAYDGRFRSLGALRGRPVIVSVVATWAGPALIEVERLKTLERAYKGEAAVVILVLDEDPEMAAIFAETFEVPEAVGRLDNSEAFVGADGPFGPITVVPTSIVLDAEGRIVLRSDGPFPPGTPEKALDALLQR